MSISIETNPTVNFSFLLTRYRRVRLPAVQTVNQVEVALRSLAIIVENADTLPLDGLDPERLLDWRDHLLNVRRVSQATWNNYLRHLKLLVHFGHESGDLPVSVNPFSGVKRVQEYQCSKKVIPSADLRLLMAYLDQEKADMEFYPVWFWKVAIRTLYYTGMRRRQLVSLRWADVDFSRCVIRLRADSSKTKREWSIPIPAPLHESLEVLRAATVQVRGRVPLAEEQVFCVQWFNRAYKGKETSVGQVSGFFKRLKNKSGIAVSAHRFRHTLGTKVAATGQIRDLQKQLGHTDLKTTMGYVQPDLGRMRDMLEVLGDF